MDTTDPQLLLMLLCLSLVVCLPVNDHTSNGGAWSRKSPFCSTTPLIGCKEKKKEALQRRIFVGTSLNLRYLVHGDPNSDLAHSGIEASTNDSSWNHFNYLFGLG